MNSISFTAEASVYKTDRSYRQAAPSNILVGNYAVTPQDCGILKKLSCGAAIAGCSALCIDACIFGGPAACALCWPTCLGATLYGFCKDCIPDVGGDGGGGGGTPANCTRTGRCGRPGNLPCCPGYYCTGERCQPVGTDPL